MAKVLSTKELINKRFGEEGTPERDKFREDAFSFYYGEILKNRRKELNMSQENLANIIGKKRTYISRIENGEDILMSNFTLLANALGLSIDLKSNVEAN